MTLPAVQTAQLPGRYEAAKVALRECARIDECKDWRDKALAMASYARQAQDETLMKLAVRIQARASRRSGELMKLFQRQGARTELSEGSDTKLLTQRQAAVEAGISKSQEVQARRIAEIPEEEFEALVESDDPPTLSKLAEIGRKVSENIKPPGFAEATQMIGQLKEFADYCRDFDPAAIGGIMPSEIATIRRRIRTIDIWLDWLSVNLTDPEEE
jgi:hypothetical protein